MYIKIRVQWNIHKIYGWWITVERFTTKNMYLVFSELNKISCDKAYSSQTFNNDFKA